jgi:hypothetical protein
MSGKAFRAPRRFSNDDPATKAAVDWLEANFRRSQWCRPSRHHITVCQWNYWPRSGALREDFGAETQHVTLAEFKKVVFQRLRGVESKSSRADMSNVAPANSPDPTPELDVDNKPVPWD